jgi:dihydroorotase
MKEIILKSPFDAHVHWRQRNTLMGQVAPYTINQFAGALLMPNTSPNIVSEKELSWYQDDIRQQLKDEKFLALTTYYLSPTLSETDFDFALNSRFCFGGVKYYPKGGTTNSSKGSLGFSNVMHVLEYMQEKQIPLLIHGEVAAGTNGVMIDDFYREQVFYETEMENLRKRFPELPLVMEHITTQEAVEFVLRSDKVRATITPQHLLFDRRALFNGVTANDQSFFYDLGKNGMHPAQMCRPILKSEKHVNALRGALLIQYKEGLHKFGLGTDSAPHTIDKKYCECGACGVFSAPIALQLYAMAFDEIGILDHLSVFACDVMPEFYKIKNKLPYKEVSLEKNGIGTIVSNDYHGITTPFAGQKIPWKVSISS